MKPRRRTWALLGRNRRTYVSRTPGRFGGHRGTHVYGRLDCRSALRAIARGGYVKSRVFFRDAATARAAGYRPCAVCLPREYARWKKSQGPTPAKRRPSLKPRRAG